MASSGCPAWPPAARPGPASPAADTGEDLRKMRKAELMKYAASMGAKTRREGGRIYRPVEEVRAGCATARHTAETPGGAHMDEDPRKMRKAELVKNAASLGVKMRRGARRVALQRKLDPAPRPGGGMCLLRRAPAPPWSEIDTEIERVDLEVDVRARRCQPLACGHKSHSFLLSHLGPADSRATQRRLESLF